MRLRRKPPTTKRGAKAVSLKATSWAVIVVPMLAPMTRPIDPRKEIAPALTSPTAMTVVAVLDWVIAETPAPATAPRRGVRVAFWRRVQKRSPAAWRTSSENLSMP